MKLLLFPLLASAGALVALSTAPEQRNAEPYKWRLPKGFPEPRVPADNPMSNEKVELGRYLFYDARLSGNGKQSCASCHRPEKAFSDDKPTSPGSTGEPGVRKAMSLVNVAYAAALTWGDANLNSLEKQALTPMFGSHPVEMGLNKDNRFLATIKTDPTYKRLFSKAFPKEKSPVSVSNITKAIACFERTLISGESPYDRYHFGGDDTAISDAAKRGEELFFSQKLACFHCHSGFNFSDATWSKTQPEREVQFHNTGLYNIPGPTSYPMPNLGIYNQTQKRGDIGKFRAPTLRNIELRAPYMHDGSVTTLDAVLDHYAAGGRTIRGGAFAGIGKDNPNKDMFVGGFELSKEDRSAVIEFLQTLTDKEFVNNRAFKNPWPSTSP